MHQNQGTTWMIYLREEEEVEYRKPEHQCQRVRKQQH
jgi:hypothetical protein